MRRLLLAFVVLCACGRPTPAPEPSPEPTPQASEPLIQYDDQGRRISRGFLKNVPRKLEPLSEAEQTKQAALEAAEAAAARVPLTPAQAARRIRVDGEVVWAIDVYRDDTLLRRIAATGWESPVPLGEVLGADTQGVASVLAHGDSGSRWFTSDEISTLQLRLNRQGRLKLEVMGRRGRQLGGGGQGTGKGTGGRTGGGTGDGTGKGKQRGNKRRFREREIQGLFWLELRATPVPAEVSTDRDVDQRSVERTE